MIAPTSPRVRSLLSRARSPQHLSSRSQSALSRTRSDKGNFGTNIKHQKAPPHWMLDIPEIKPNPIAQDVFRITARLPQIRKIQDFLSQLVQGQSDDNRVLNFIERNTGSPEEKLELLTCIIKRYRSNQIVVLGLRTAVETGNFAVARNYLSMIQIPTLGTEEAITLIQSTVEASNATYKTDYRFGSWKRREALSFIMGDSPNLMEYVDQTDQNVKYALEQCVGSLGARLENESSSSQETSSSKQNVDPTEGLEDAILQVERIFNELSSGAPS